MSENRLADQLPRQQEVSASREKQNPRRYQSLIRWVMLGTAAFAVLLSQEAASAKDPSPPKNSTYTSMGLDGVPSPIEELLSTQEVVGQTVEKVSELPRLEHRSLNKIVDYVYQHPDQSREVLKNVIEKIKNMGGHSRLDLMIELESGQYLFAQAENGQGAPQFYFVQFDNETGEQHNTTLTPEEFFKRMQTLDIAKTPLTMSLESTTAVPFSEDFRHDLDQNYGDDGLVGGWSGSSRLEVRMYSEAIGGGQNYSTQLESNYYLKPVGAISFESQTFPEGIIDSHDPNNVEFSTPFLNNVVHPHTADVSGLALAKFQNEMRAAYQAING